jgi:branched-chain amino acid transport system permease protein
MNDPTNPPTPVRTDAQSTGEQGNEVQGTGGPRNGRLRNGLGGFARSGVRAWFANLPAPARWGVLAGVAVLAYLLPYIRSIPLIGPQIITQGSDWSSTLFTMTYFVLLALGLNVVVGYAGLLDLGYVGFFAVGAYTVALLTSPDSHYHVHWTWLAAVPVAVGVAMLSGLILGWPTLRLRGDYLAIVTLGFAEIIKDTADNTTSTAPYLGGDQGLTQIPHPPGQTANGPLFGILNIKPYFWLGLSVIIVVMFAIRNLDRSRVGRSWLAIREDEEAAEIMGVRTVKYKLWAFSIGAAVGGLGGVMFAGKQGFVNSSTFVLQFSILILAGVVMGGAGNMAGAILGGALIAYIPERLRGVRVLGGVTDQVKALRWLKPVDIDAFKLRFWLFGLTILLIMIFRPQGIIPSRRRAMELKDRAKEVAP